MFQAAYKLFMQNQHVYLTGLLNTLEAAAFGLVFALIIGLIAGITRYASNGIWGKLVAAYVSLVRNTPMVVQVYFIYFGLPAVGITLSAFSTGVVALAFNSGAYLAEIIRGGLNALPAGQAEAAHAIGLRRGAALRSVLLPQTIPIVLPAVTGQFVQLVKDTSLLYTIAVLELMQAANQVGNESYKFLEAYIVAWAFYLAVCIVLNVLIDSYEKQSGFSKHLRA